MSVFVPVPHHLITVALLVLREVRGHDASSFVFFFLSSRLLWLFGMFHGFVLLFCGKCHVCFDRDCVKSVDCFE